MLFGCCGAHRSGKSTLARAVAENLGIHFHDAGVSRIIGELGISSVADLPMDERLAAQVHLLDRYLTEIRAAPRPCITDRTPLDFIGYAMAEVTMHNTSPELGEKVATYADLCLSATANHFDYVFTLRPLPSFKEDPAKPPLNAGYQWLVQHIIEGGVRRLTGKINEGLVKTTDLDRRVDAMTDLIAKRIDALAKQRATAAWIH